MIRIATFAFERPLWPQGRKHVNDKDHHPIPSQPGGARQALRPWCMNMHARLWLSLPKRCSRSWVQVTVDCFLFFLLGQQEGAFSPGAVHDVWLDGVAVPAPLRNFAQGRAKGTEAESHIQNWLWQQVTSLSSKKEAFFPHLHPTSFLSPSEKLGFTFSDEFATFYLGEAATNGPMLVCLCNHPVGRGETQVETGLLMQWLLVG